MTHVAGGSVWCLMIALLFFSNGGAQDWSFDDSETWGEEYPGCNGPQQSPIELNASSAQTQWSFPFYDGAISIDFKDYNKAANGSLTNTGLTVQLVLNYESKSTTPRLIIKANGVSTTYYFQSFNFHWKSPHHIDGVRYPLEMHMVHQTDDGRRLGLAYLFKVCKKSGDGMETIGSHVKNATRFSTSVDIKNFSPSCVMPHSLSICNYFQYNGSLTYPPCTEGIPWVVYREPQCAEDWQVASFYEITNEMGQKVTNNARPVQPINGRTVIYHRCILRF